MLLISFESFKLVLENRFYSDISSQNLKPTDPYFLLAGSEIFAFFIADFMLLILSPFIHQFMAPDIKTSFP